MSLVSYNDLQLELVRTADWFCRLVYDETNSDPLYIHHRMSWECMLNPTLSTAIEPASPIFRNLELLRQHLLTPQKQLLVTDEQGGIALLLPRGGAATDAKNGPHPLNVRIFRVVGVKTLQIVFDIECYEPLDCPEKDISVLSHRWESSEDIDETFLRTRHISGRAVFRTDRLLLQGVVPDDFRARLHHPIPPNHKRVSVRVTAFPDGTGTSYEIVDRQMPVNIDPRMGIAKIEGHYQQGFADDNWIYPANRYCSVVIRAWGYPTTQRTWLIAAVMGAAITYGFTRGLVPPKANPGFSGEVTVDLFNRFAEFRAGYLTGGSVARSVRAADSMGRAFRLPDNFPEQNGITTTERTDNPRPPADSGTRSVLEKLVAQALNGKCGKPIAPVFRVSDPKTSYGWD